MGVYTRKNNSLTHSEKITAAINTACHALGIFVVLGLSVRTAFFLDICPLKIYYYSIIFVL